MKLNISDKHFFFFLIEGYDIKIVFLLKLLHEGNEIDSLCKEHEKIAAMKQFLIRKNLISEEGKIIPAGQELLLFLDTKIAGKIAKKVPTEGNGFSEWWATYPGVSQFTYKGKLFVGDRALRVKKDDCRLKFEKILAEGIHTAQDLINALKLEINSKMESSLKENTNKLKYMQNSLTYLNQSTYEPFVELYKTQKEIEQTVIINGVDI